jgi:hypothetical protein
VTGQEKGMARHRSTPAADRSRDIARC